MHLTPGTHQWSHTGNCVCTNSWGNHCNNGPYVMINGTRHNINNRPISFNVN